MIWRLGFLLATAIITLPVAAQDAAGWLSKVSAASQKLDYSGIFVYQHDGLSETSRIAHFVENGQEYEYLEVLDGSPREVIRQGDEVMCYFPESRTVIVERRRQRRSFPDLLPAGLSGMTEFYQVRKLQQMRTSGMETQVLKLEPQDNLRYGYQLWVDAQSGLLVKAALLNENGDALESFAFTEITFGKPSERDRAKAKQRSGTDWRVQNVEEKSGRVEDSGWRFNVMLPGFHRVSSMRRQVAMGGPESLHYLFSDGLASISVFIEPLNGRSQTIDRRVASIGAINVYKRVVADNQIVVMGEVPAITVRKLGEGIEFRRNK